MSDNKHHYNGNYIGDNYTSTNVTSPLEQKVNNLSYIVDSIFSSCCISCKDTIPFYSNSTSALPICENCLSTLGRLTKSINNAKFVK